MWVFFIMCHHRSLSIIKHLTFHKTGKVTRHLPHVLFMYERIEALAKQCIQYVLLLKLTTIQLTDTLGSVPCKSQSPFHHNTHPLTHCY